MRRLLGFAAGLAVAALTGQAYAAPTCVGTPLVSTNGEDFAASALSAGVCVQAVDKLYGNFDFGTSGTHDVVFSWSDPVGGTHTIAFNDSFAGGATGSSVSVGFAVADTTPGSAILSLTGDFEQSTPTTSSLVKTTTPTGTGTINFTKLQNVPLPPDLNLITYGSGVPSITVAETLTLGTNASVSGIEDTITESTPMPEPASLALLGTGLVGLGYIVRRRRKSA